MTGECWNPHTKTDIAYPKAKKKPQPDGRRNTNTIKSNPIFPKWVINNLKNNNTKEVLPLLWRFCASYQASQPGISGKQTGNPRGIWLWRRVGFDYRTSTGLGEIETPLLEGTNKTLCALGPGGRNSDTTGDWARSTCGCLRTSSRGMAGSGLPWGQVHWRQHSWDTHLGVSPHRGCHEPYHKASRIQNWVASGQTTTRRERSPTYQKTVGLKFYWARPCPPEKDLHSLPHSQPSHQEACTSLLSSSTRGQTEERRTTSPQSKELIPQSQKANQNEKK